MSDTHDWQDGYLCSQCRKCLCIREITCDPDGEIVKIGRIFRNLIREEIGTEDCNFERIRDVLIE